MAKNVRRTFVRDRKLPENFPCWRLCHYSVNDCSFFAIMISSNDTSKSFLFLHPKFVAPESMFVASAAPDCQNQNRLDPCLWSPCYFLRPLIPSLSIIFFLVIKISFLCSKSMLRSPGFSRAQKEKRTPDVRFSRSKDLAFMIFACCNFDTSQPSLVKAVFSSISISSLAKI